jgi:outer membrane receptor protein involved in Fe transport
MSEILHNVENGYFQFNQAFETGADFADFLLGAPGVFQQGETPAGNTLNFYLGAFAQDSWRLRPNLTLNYGVRWDVISPWWEKHNEIETLSLGEQSVVFPNSPAGWVFPTDPGISRTIAPIRYNNFAPRLGLAYSPSADSGFFNKLLGAPGQTSLRLGYGMFFSAFEGGYDFSVIGDAPYGEFNSQNGVSLSNPYEYRATGATYQNPFPFTFPPTNVTASNPDPNVPSSTFGTVGTSPAFNPTNRVPYAEQYELSIQRQLTAADLLTITYVGTQGHRLLVTQEANPVNQAACLALYNSNPLLSGCGPNSEPSILRAPFGANFASEGVYSSIGKSSYNSAQINFQHKSGPLQVLVGYTYGKALDTSSAFGEQAAPMTPNFNPNMTRGLSSFNIPQNVVMSYNYTLPFAKLGGPKMLVDGWQLSGITTFSKGLPVYIFENDDNSLLGTDNSGPLPLGIDTPNYSGGSVQKLNARNPTHAFFDTSKFSAEPIGHLGTARRRFFQGSGINDFNTSLSKDTTFFDRYTLQFRAEFFNVFNHTQFSAVDGNFNSSTFGQATSAADPRIGQLALKLQF